MRIWTKKNYVFRFKTNPSIKYLQAAKFINHFQEKLETLYFMASKMQKKLNSNSIRGKLI
jgi:hypothetical protein